MGTFGNDKYTSEEVSNAVYGAIQAGYRLFDCAAAYGNEKDIGDVFSKAFSEGLVQRQDLTIMTKVWNDMHGKGDVLVACAQSLRDLGLSYLDIYMVHWPFPNYHAPGAHLEGRNPDAVPFSVEEYMGVWRQMERLVDLGLVKSIGMSNMTITKLKQVLPLCRIRPTVLEIEINPTFQQSKLFDYCKEQGILPIAFSPLGSPCRPERDTEPDDVGNLKCTTEDFLTKDEMERLKKADRNQRLIKGKVFLWEEAKDWRDIWDGEDEWNELK